MMINFSDYWNDLNYFHTQFYYAINLDYNGKQLISKQLCIMNINWLLIEKSSEDPKLLVFK